jgi:hypothetical protein
LSAASGKSGALAAKDGLCKAERFGGVR